MTYARKIGNAPDSQPIGSGGYTFIDLNNAASESCTINECQIYAGGSTTSKIKIFRDDGTNYLFIDEESVSCVSGVNYIEIDMNIVSGDYIGYYQSSSSGIKYQEDSGTYRQKSGDVTTNTIKSSWSSVYTGTHSVGAGYGNFYYVKTTGNDSLSGYSWANAWKTINKAATTVTDGSTVHIGFGTYDAEPGANKIAPQNVGATGIYYLPETATTGGGTGTVSVEQNT